MNTEQTSINIFTLDYPTLYLVQGGNKNKINKQMKKVYQCSLEILINTSDPVEKLLN